MNALTEDPGMLGAVLLDFGHTIVDFALNERALVTAYEEVRALLVAAAVDEVPSAEALVDAISGRLSRRIHESYERQDLQELDVLAELESLLADIDVHVPPELIHRIAEIEHRALMAELYVPPSNLDALSSLRADGLRLGLVSNIAYVGELVRMDLDRLGLLDLFHTVVLSSEVGVRKPHPSIYQTALAQLGLPGDRVVFVGDRLREDVGGPQAAGMRAILTREFRVDMAVEDSAVPDCVIGRLSDLPAAVRRLRVVGHCQ